VHNTWYAILYLIWPSESDEGERTKWFTNLVLNPAQLVQSSSCLHDLHDAELVNWFLGSTFPRWVIRRLSVCTRVPHRESNSKWGPRLYNVGILNLWRCLARTGNRPGTLGPSPVRSPLDYHFTPTGPILNARAIDAPRQNDDINIVAGFWWCSTGATEDTLRC